MTVSIMDLANDVRAAEKNYREKDIEYDALCERSAAGLMSGEDIVEDDLLLEAEQARDEAWLIYLDQIKAYVKETG